MLIKVYASLLLSIVSVQALALVDCSELKGCDKKYCAIEKQLQIAKAQNNKHQISGLTKSLENAKKTCTDTGLKNELTGKIKKANADIAGYEADLKKAQEKGNVTKIAKYQAKIKQKKIEIKGLEEDLAELN